MCYVPLSLCSLQFLQNGMLSLSNPYSITSGYTVGNLWHILVVYMLGYFWFMLHLKCFMVPCFSKEHKSVFHSVSPSCINVASEIKICDAEQTSMNQASDLVKTTLRLKQ